jgi:hypothetical protein
MAGAILAVNQRSHRGKPGGGGAGQMRHKLHLVVAQKTAHSAQPRLCPSHHQSKN